MFSFGGFPGAADGGAGSRGIRSFLESRFVMTLLLRRFAFWGASALAAALCVGCSTEEDFGSTNPYGDMDPATLVFPDVEKSNVDPKEDLFALPFVDSTGKPVELKKFLGVKNVCLVMMRGFPGFVCPGCTAQTSRLIRNEKEFQARECEVLIVFPGPKDHLVDFVQAAQSYADGKKLPFPLLLDENFSAVDKLGIRGELAKPSTYILDKKGRIRFAYVGASLTDRPSLKAMLRELDEVVKNEKEEAAADASPSDKPQGGKKEDPAAKEGAAKEEAAKEGAAKEEAAKEEAAGKSDASKSGPPAEKDKEKAPPATEPKDEDTAGAPPERDPRKEDAVPTAAALLEGAPRKNR